MLPELVLTAVEGKDSLHNRGSIPQFEICYARFTDTPGVLSCLLFAFEQYFADYAEHARADTILTPETH